MNLSAEFDNFKLLEQNISWYETPQKFSELIDAWDACYRAFLIEGAAFLKSIVNENTFWRRFSNVEYLILKIFTRQNLDKLPLLELQDSRFDFFIGKTSFDDYNLLYLKARRCLLNVNFPESKPEPAIVPADEKLPENAKMSVKDLSLKYKIPHDALRKSLERFRKNSFTGWIETADVGRHEAKFLYDETAVLPIIQKIQKRDGQNRP
jgi:hypothetical protein